MSVTKLSALLKPNDSIVAATSFWTDFGTQTVLRPLRWSLKRVLIDRAPTTETTPSIPSCASRARTSSDRSSSSTWESTIVRTRKGSLRGAVPRMHPSLPTSSCRSPGVSGTSPPPGYRSGKSSPSYPSWMPKTSQPSSREASTVPAMTALSPGTYPPPKLTAMRLVCCVMTELRRVPAIALEARL